jgi:hypothetical protein
MPANHGRAEPVPLHAKFPLEFKDLGLRCVPQHYGRESKQRCRQRTEVKLAPTIVQLFPELGSRNPLDHL